MAWYDTTCCVRGSTAGAISRPSATSAHQGDDASTRKKQAPVRRTARRTSESGSSPGASGGGPDAASRGADARSWPRRTANPTLRSMEDTPMNDLPRSGWQLVEDSAEAYERYLVPLFFEPWAERLLAGAGVRSGERV